MLMRNKTIILFIAMALFISSCNTTKNVTGKSSKENTAATDKIKTKYAKLLNVDVDKIDNAKLYTFIDDWYGVKYKYGGKNKQGVDCSGFVAVLYNDVYKKELSGPVTSLFYECKGVSKDKLTEGDLVFFKIEDDNVSHVGVYLQNNKFVHASVKKGIMIDDLDEAYYKKYFYKGGKLPH